MPDTTLTSADLDELEREIEDGRVSRLSMHTALASRILAAARAGLEAGKAEEWLPIETAPRDGADIILGSEPQMFNGQPVPARPPMTDTIDVAALVERLRSHEGIGAALAHDRGQTGRFVTAIMDEAATALQSQADALAEARRENEALRGETFLASAEAAEHHRDNAIKMWDEERKLRTTAEASLATMREALRGNWHGVFLDGRNEHGSHVLNLPERSIELEQDSNGYFLKEYAEKIIAEAERLGFEVGHAVVVTFTEQNDDDLGGYYEFSTVSLAMTELMYGSADEQREFIRALGGSNAE